MSFKPIPFESSRVKEAARQELREARDQVLSRAKDDYDRREANKERAKQRGDDKWMLPSVEARLESERKNKKSKKQKKKKKKQQKKKISSSDSDSSSESEQDEWVEKPCAAAGGSNIAASSSSTTRDEWMTLPGLIPCVTRDELRQNNKATREDEQKMNTALNEPGRSTRELNPYWKDGGSGLPEEVEKLDVRLADTTVGDQGVGWLRKALQRVFEQAAETGRTPQEVAAERWGSLEKLEALLAEAEGRKDNFKRPSLAHRQIPRFARPAEEFCVSRDSSCERPTKRSPERGPRSRDSPERSSRLCESPDRSSRAHYSPERRSRSRESPDRGSRYGRAESSSRTCDDRSRGRSERASRSQSSYSRSDRSLKRHRTEDSADRSLDSRYDDRAKRGFMKPSADDDDFYSRDFKSRPSGSKNWKKMPENPPERKKVEAAVSKTKSSSSSSEDENITEGTEVKLLSEKEMNDIGAKIVKAEILGNEALAKDLKNQLEAARKALAEASVSGKKQAKGGEEVVILSRTDSRGVTRPLEAPTHLEPQAGRRKKQKVETHNKAGQRERYFADDDKYRLQDMFTREKMNSVEDSNYEFAKLIGKGAARAEAGEGDLDEMFEENARYKESDGKAQRREREQAVKEHQRVSRALEGCRWCVDSKQMLKHLIIAIGSKVYLSLPPYKSLTEGHCILAPTLHSPCATQLDEDVWEEMQVFRKALTKMFADKGEDVVFFETARNLRNFPHMVLECVPLDRESGNLAPIYFKKAIQECETEWSSNKKLVELAGRGVRRSIPKGLPYFAVCFGNDDGFGHVIEDESQFPHNFAQEIIGGILDLDHQIWRKKHNENFEAQRRKVLDFSRDWAPHDFTQKKKPQDDSSTSDSD